MEANLRISLKDYRRNKSVKILLRKVPFSVAWQFRATMIGEPDPRMAGRFR